MTVTPIGLRAQIEKSLWTEAARRRAFSRIANREDSFTVLMQERVIEYMSQPALEDIALPRPQRDECETEIVYVQRYVE